MDFKTSDLIYFRVFKPSLVGIILGKSKCTKNLPLSRKIIYSMLKMPSF